MKCFIYFFVFQGWINEMDSYDLETYHPSLMHSVYATLEGPYIRLDYPSSNIPRWATFNEPFNNRSFTHSRTLHLDGSKVCARSYDFFTIVSCLMCLVSYVYLTGTMHINKY